MLSITKCPCSIESSFGSVHGMEIKGGQGTSTFWNAIYRVVQKTDPLVYFDDNFGKYRLI